MDTTTLKTSPLGQTDLEITRVGFGAWAIGGGGWEFGWGPQEDEQSVASDPPGARAGRQLDRYRRRLRIRPLRADRRTRARRPGRAAIRVHQVLAAGGARATCPAQPQARLDPARGRGQPEAARGRRDRSLPDPLAESGGGHRGGLDGARRAEGAGPRPAHRRLELRRRAAAAYPADRSRRDASAAVLAGRARGRARSPAVRRTGGNRRDRVLADGLRDAEREHDPRADRRPGRRRLAQA